LNIAFLLLQLVATAVDDDIDDDEPMMQLAIIDADQ